MPFSMSAWYSNSSKPIFSAIGKCSCSCHSFPTWHFSKKKHYTQHIRWNIKLPSHCLFSAYGEQAPLRCLRNSLAPATTNNATTVEINWWNDKFNSTDNTQIFRILEPCHWYIYHNMDIRWGDLHQLVSINLARLLDVHRSAFTISSMVALRVVLDHVFEFIELKLLTTTTQ